MDQPSIRGYLAAVVAIVALQTQAGESDNYPVRPIRLIVPASVGSPPDVVARLLSDRLKAAFRQAVVIDNRPGASGAIGMDALAKASADGHTLGALGMPFLAVTPKLIANLRFDPARDFAPATLLAWNYNILVVPTASPVVSVGELVAAAKARPGHIRYGSGGNGTPAHLTSELLKREANIDVRHIPYKGGPAAAAALLVGEVDMMIGAVGAISPYLEAGKLRALATSAPSRLKAFPEIPTLIEAGYPNVVLRDCQVIVAPASTPVGVLRRLDAALRAALSATEVQQRLELLGMVPAGLGPAEAAQQIALETRRWSRLILELGIRSE